jgi:hypothetical protein
VILDRWDEAGTTEQTERWRSVLSEISLIAADELTGVSNSFKRAAAVRQRYVLDFKHLTGPRGSWHGSTSSGLTRISDWTALADRERADGRPGSPFVLCCGIPSGLADAAGPAAENAVDFAIRITVPPTFLPSGLLLLDGVPLVVHRHRPFRPLPGKADELWPPEPAIPGYLSPRLDSQPEIPSTRS